MDTNNKQFGIFLDIDGTILGESAEAFEETIAAIQKVRSLGHKCFVATGRATAYLPEILNVKKNFDGVISGAGTTIKIGDKMIFEAYVPFEVVDRFSQYVFENKTAAILEGHEKMYHFGYGEGIHFDSVHLDVGKEWVLVTEENYKNIITPQVKIEKFTVIGQVDGDIDRVLGDEYVLIRHSVYGEAFQKKCGKDKALLRVMEELGLPVSQSIAMGDSMNDYDMLLAAGYAVAMGQSVQEIKDIADMITDPCNSAGVKTAMKKIFNF